MWMRGNNKWLGKSRITKHLYICVSENLLNGDSPYPQLGPIGKVLPLPTPVEIAERTDGNGSDDDIGSSPVSSLDKRHAHTHTMSTRRVCWHRNTSISMTEHSLSVRVSILYLILFQDNVHSPLDELDRQLLLVPQFHIRLSSLSSADYILELTNAVYLYAVPRNENASLY